MANQLSADNEHYVKLIVTGHPLLIDLANSGPVSSNLVQRPDDLAAVSPDPVTQPAGVSHRRCRDSHGSGDLLGLASRSVIVP
jgi:hypothetical protein